MTEISRIEGTDVARHDEVSTDPMVDMIQRLVLNPDADLDKLERMLAMKERMEAQSASIAFARALSDARAEIPPITKDATVDYGKGEKRTTYRHETLAGIARVIDPILSKHGLSYRYRTIQGNGGVCVTCVIQHSGGHSEETSLSGAPDGSGSKNGFQAVGSAVTYLQRYTLKAALGLSAEVDDDAQAATPRHEPRAEPQQQRPPEGPTPRQQADRLIAEIHRAKGDKGALKALWDDRKSVMADLPDDLFEEVKAKFADAGKAEKATDPAYDDEIPL